MLKSDSADLVLCFWRKLQRFKDFFQLAVTSPLFGVRIFPDRENLLKEEFSKVVGSDGLYLLQFCILATVYSDSWQEKERPPRPFRKMNQLKRCLSKQNGVLGVTFRASYQSATCVFKKVFVTFPKAWCQSWRARFRNWMAPRFVNDRWSSMLFRVELAYAPAFRSHWGNDLWLKLVSEGADNTSELIIKMRSVTVNRTTR